MKVARLIFVSILATASISVFAQANGYPISTDRPSFSDTPNIIPKGRWQIEGGYTYNRIGGARFETFGELLFRFPLQESLELRLSNVAIGRSSGGADGLLDPLAGLKYKFRSGGIGRGPDVAAILQTTVPAGDDAFRIDRSQPTAKLAWYQQTDAITGFGGNLIYSDLGENAGRFPQWAASLYVSRTLDPKTGVFAEVYRLMPIGDGGPDANFFDVGVGYLLNQAMQVDFRIGTGFNQSRDGWFVGAGMAYRF